MPAIVSVEIYLEPDRRPVADDFQALRPRASHGGYRLVEFTERRFLLKHLYGLPWLLVGEPWWYWRVEDKPDSLAQWLSNNAFRGVIAGDRIVSGVHIIEKNGERLDLWWVSLGPFWTAFVVAEPSKPRTPPVSDNDLIVVVIGVGACSKPDRGPSSEELGELERRIQSLSAR